MYPNLFFALDEVLHLHPALIDQSFQALVQATRANAQFFCSLALGHVRSILQHAQDLEVGVFLILGSTIGHCEVVWQRYRHAASWSAYRDGVL